MELVSAIYCKKATEKDLEDVRKMIEEEWLRTEKSELGELRVSVIPKEKVVLVFSNLSDDWVNENVVHKALLKKYAYFPKDGIINLPPFTRGQRKTEIPPFLLEILKQAGKREPQKKEK